MMRKLSVRLSIVVLAASGLVHSSARAAPSDVSVGASFDSDGLRGFHLSISEHYHCRPEVVTRIRARRIPDEHIPVVFFLAQHAHTTPEAIVALRLGGKSWFDISAHFGLSVDIFHVEVHDHYGPPYGRALGHFRNRKRAEWRSIRLVDDDVVCLVNLQFLSARHGCSPDAVIKLHGKGDSFLNLHGKLKVKVQGGGPAKGLRAATKGAGASVSVGGSSGRKSAGFSASGSGKRNGGGGRGKKK